LAETSATATNAHATPISASRSGCSPSSRPTITGTLAPITAEIGETTPMRPAASAA
jgi:hypothetical protein